MRTNGTAAPEGRVARRQALVRQRILTAAETLMSARGVDEVTIDDIADAADIARRSFYHYFPTKHDLLVPIARARTRALNRRLDALVASIPDPAEGMATAMRHALRMLTRDALCRWFVLSSGLPHLRLQEGLGESGMRDARRGVEAGRFRVANAEVVRVLMSGAFIALLGARAENTLDDADVDDAVEHLLRLLGLSLSEAHDIAHRPLPALPPQPRTEPRGRQPARAAAP
jgi:AcrR family transcriptional regulator